MHIPTLMNVWNAIAAATGLTPAEIDADVLTSAIKEQNAQRSVALWVGSQAEYNAIQAPDENTLYVVTDPNETNELQNQVDLMKAQLDKMNAIIWSYPNGVPFGEVLEHYAEFSQPISDYEEIIVTCKIDNSAYKVHCTKQNSGIYSVHVGSLYIGNETDNILISAFLRRHYDQNESARVVYSEIYIDITPFSEEQTKEQMSITEIRGLI